MNGFRSNNQGRQHVPNGPAITLCSIDIDELDPSRIRRDPDGRRFLDLLITNGGEVIQSLDRPRGQRTRPCGNWRTILLDQTHPRCGPTAAIGRSMLRSPSPSAMSSSAGTNDDPLLHT